MMLAKLTLCKTKDIAKKSRRPTKGRSFFCSWSGGKDCCLALHYAIKKWGKPALLLTMLTEDGKRSRSHGLSTRLIKKQAAALGIPVIFHAASWINYETVFISALGKLKEQGIKTGVFGDIDIESHRQWVEKACSYSQVKAYHPLWQKPRGLILKQFLKDGFKATIIAVKENSLDRRFLGKNIDTDLINQLEVAGVDICGENGEFHSVVTDGPIFTSPLHLEIKQKVLKDGYWFIDVS